MTLVTGTVQDLGYDGMDGTLWARPARFRSDGSVVYAPERKPFKITGGVVSAELAPGPAVLELQVGSHARGTFEVVIPEEDVTLADLLDTVFPWEPEQVSLFVAERLAAEAAAGTATAAAGSAAASALQTGQDRTAVALDRVAVEDTRDLLDAAYDQSQAGMTLPPRLMESALNATYARAGRVNLVVDGDSLTYGVGAPAGWSYPEQLLAGMPGGTTLTNLGVGGQNAAQMLADAATQVDPLVAPGVNNVLVAMVGINSIYQEVAVATIFDQIVQYHQGRRAAGFKTVAVTVLPATGNGPPASAPQAIADLNALIRSQWSTFADALVDAAASAPFTTEAVTENLTFYSTDRVHLNPRGYGELANLIRGGLGQVGTISGIAPAAALASTRMTRVEDRMNGNVRVGHLAANPADPATITTAVGTMALHQLTTGTGNTAVGQQAGRSITTSINGTFVGSLAGYSTAASRATAVGNGAAYNTTAGEYVAIGYRALYSNTSGIGSVAIGSEALYSGTVVSHNVAIGMQALRESTGNYNTAFGYRSGYAPGGSTANATTTGFRNVFVGQESGAGGANHSDIVALGYRAVANVNGTALGSGAVTGTSATAVGKGATATGKGSVAIGIDGTATPATATVENEFVLGTALHRVKVPGLPTTAPAAGSGILWNDAGTVKVA